MLRNSRNKRPSLQAGRSGEKTRQDPVAHTFLVRLWKEARESTDDKPIWRGIVSDLRGRQLGCFSSAAELVGILGDMSGTNVLLRVSCVDRSPGS